MTEKGRLATACRFSTNARSGCDRNAGAIPPRSREAAPKSTVGDRSSTIDNSTMIVGPVGDAYYFAINAAYFAINAALSAI